MASASTALHKDTSSNEQGGSSSGQAESVRETTTPVVVDEKATKSCYVALQAQVENNGRAMQVMLVHSPGLSKLFSIYFLLVAHKKPYDLVFRSVGLSVFRSLSLFFFLIS